MLSGRGKKEYAKEAQAVADEASGANGAAEEPLEAIVAMYPPGLAGSHRRDATDLGGR